MVIGPRRGGGWGETMRELTHTSTTTRKTCHVTSELRSSHNLTHARYTTASSLLCTAPLCPLKITIPYKPILQVSHVRASIFFETTIFYCTPTDHRPHIPENGANIEPLKHNYRYPHRRIRKYYSCEWY